MAGLARLLLPSHAVHRCEAVYDMTISRQEIFGPVLAVTKFLI